MKTKRVFNPKFWSHREGRYSGNIICIFASSRWGFAATNLWVKSRLTKYIIVFTPRWLKVPILEMRSISERWLLYEPQYYCPGIDRFISVEIKNVINFIRISSLIAGKDVHHHHNNNQKILELSTSTLTVLTIDLEQHWLWAKIVCQYWQSVLTDSSFMRNISSGLILHTHSLSKPGDNAQIQARAGQ